MKIFIKLLLFVIALAALYLLVLKPDLLINPDKPNTAADGFSRFYANFRSNMQQGGSQSDYILRLQDSSDELILMLRRREQQVTPLTTSWRGEVVRRRFHAGGTLKDALQAYAQQEQMVLFWTLPRDYVIKQFFETNSSLFDTINEMAVTISPDFSKPVQGYFCPKSRALVLTDLDDPFLQQHCFATGPTAQTSR